MKEYIIEINDDLRLRPLSQNDAEDLQKIADNKNIWRWVQDRFPHPYSLQDARNYIEQSGNSDDEFIRAIEFEQKVVGVIGLKKKNGLYRFSAEMGYWIGEPYWNMGFATQAVKAMLSIAFDSWNLMRVYAFTMQGNDSSQRVLEKSEFTYEGVRRKAAYKDGKFHDELLFSILKDEFKLIH